MNVKTIGREYGVLLLLGVLGIPIGAAIGAVDVLFGRVLLAVSAVRAAHVMPLLLFLAPIGVAIVWAYAKYGGISGQGHVPCVRGRTRKRKQYPASVGSVCHGQYMADASVRRQCRQGRRCRPARRRALAQLWQAAGSIYSGCRANLSHHRHGGGLFRIVSDANCRHAVCHRGAVCGQFGTVCADSGGDCLVYGVLGFQRIGIGKIFCRCFSKASMDLPLLGKLAVLGVLFGLTGGVFAWGLRQAKTLAARALPQPLVRIAVMASA